MTINILVTGAGGQLGAELQCISNMPLQYVKTLVLFMFVSCCLYDS